MYKSYTLIHFRNNLFHELLFKRRNRIILIISLFQLRGCKSPLKTGLRLVRMSNDTRINYFTQCLKKIKKLELRNIFCRKSRARTTDQLTVPFIDGRYPFGCCHRIRQNAKQLQARYNTRLRKLQNCKFQNALVELVILMSPFGVRKRFPEHGYKRTTLNELCTVLRTGTRWIGQRPHRRRYR